MKVWVLCKSDYYDSYSTEGVTSKPEVAEFWDALGTGYWTEETTLDEMTSYHFRGTPWEVQR